MTSIAATTDPTDPTTPLSELGVERVWGMLESAPDAMLMTDGAGVILAVNRQVECLFGYDRADLLGREIEVLLPDRLRGVHRAHRTRYRADPSVRAMGEGLELRARRRDGTEFPVEVSLSPLTDDQGLAVVVSIRDVTERQRLTAHVRRVQAAIDAVHDGVFMFEIDTLRFVYVNAGACAQTGYSREELLAMTPLHIKPEFTRPRFEELVAPLLAGRVDHVSLRTTHRARSGVDVPVDIVLEHRPATPDEPLVAGASRSLLVAVARDVTAQVAVEQRLSLSEETFRTSFDHAPVGMTIARLGDDGDRSLEQVNTAFAAMLGRTAESLVGVDFVEITHPDDRPQTSDAAREMASGERSSLVTEKRYRRADGTYVWALIHSIVIERSDGIRALTHVVDITDRRERQAQRLRFATMEDRERIARDLHDLVIQRLFGAGMQLQAVIPEMGSPTAVERTHRVIDDLDATIAELRSAIFSLHRRHDGRSFTAELSLAIEQHVDRLGFRPTVEWSGSVDDLPESHSGELIAVLREALSNVIRHAEASSVEVRVRVDSSVVELRVCDDGSGIDAGRPPGNGLSNLRQRAVLLGGDLVVGPSSTSGTELAWTAAL